MTQERDNEKRLRELEEYEASLPSIIENDPSWLRVRDNPQISDAMYGFHKDWIHADWCPQGIREIAYAGDHYASSKWNGCHDDWRYVDERPTHICRMFPLAASKKEAKMVIPHAFHQALEG